MTKANNCHIAVFAKAPRPGQVKTRLLPLLGPEGVSTLQRRLLEHVLHAASAAAIGPVELWCSPNSSDPDLQEAATLVAASMHDQGKGDLGKRMAQAFRAILARTPRCILIGSDCPSLTAQDLKDAADALNRHHAVLGPAEDGGYFLIGLSHDRKPDLTALFENIAWGTDAVLRSTRERLQKRGISWHEIATRWDVDRPEDYLRLCREMPELAPQAASTRASQDADDDTDADASSSFTQHVEESVEGTETGGNTQRSASQEAPLDDTPPPVKSPIEGQQRALRDEAQRAHRSMVSPDQRNVRNEPMAGFILDLQEKKVAMQIAKNVWVVTWDVFDDLEKQRREYEARQAAKSQTDREKDEEKYATMNIPPWAHSKNATRTDIAASPEKLFEEMAKDHFRREYGGPGLMFQKEAYDEASGGGTTNIGSEPRNVRVLSLAIESERALELSIKSSQKYTQLLNARSEIMRTRLQSALRARRRHRR